MKKMLKSKGFAISMLSLACVGILGVCFIASRPKEKTFQPDEAVPENTQTEWHAENSGDSSAGKVAGSYTPTAPAEEFPKVVERSDNEVVIEFTPDAEDLVPEKPQPPVSDDDRTNPSKPPSYDSDDTKIPDPHPGKPEDDKPDPGSSNGNGAVYDPVFGWVVPGKTHQDTIDSNGDPDKMVGNMGN